MQPEQTRTGGAAAPAHAPTHNPTAEGDDAPETTGDAPAILSSAGAWVRAHQTAALIGSFAVGVFLGVLLRRS